MRCKNLKIGFALAAFFVAVFANHAFAQSPQSVRAERSKYVEAEKFILEKLTTGYIANLEEKFKDNPEKRVISAEFFMALLLNPDKANVHRNGVNITGARIVGEIDVNHVEIDRFIFLEKCEFDDVSFIQTVFKKGLWINGSTFRGIAYFRNATVMAMLSADDVKFTSEKNTVNFLSLKANGLVSFDRAVFAGPVDFSNAQIDGSFIIDNVQFLCKETAAQPCRDTEVSFNSLRTNSGFSAKGALFERSVNLVNLKAAFSFQGDNVTFKKSAHFQAMTVGLTLSLAGAKFFEGADLQGVSVSVNLDLTNAQFHWEKPADFRHAKAYGVIVENTKFSRPPKLSRLTYQNIYPTAGLLDLIKNSDSDYSAYGELEQFLQRSGYSSQADEVFMEMKKYERRKGLNWFDSIKSYLSQALQGFGRRPHRVLYYDLAVLLFGAFLFRRRKMTLKHNPGAEEPQPDPKSPTTENLPPYNGFLYSLTLFAPTIDTQYTNNWQPKPDHRKTRWYMQAHKVFGYVLVPLTIAIWTGIFR